MSKSGTPTSSGSRSPAGLISSFIPEYAGKRVAILNLDREAYRAFHERWVNSAAHPRQCADAEFCTQLVHEIHARHGIDASLGGYLEDRSYLWQGTYLASTTKNLHLGIDLNVPAGSEVAIPIDCRVLRCDDDSPDRWGWGPRIFLEPIGGRESPSYLYILAHLQDLQVVAGQLVKKGAQVASVGAPPKNGDWYPHLHVQLVRREVFDTFLVDGIEGLDGYGSESEIPSILRDYPDPLSFL